MKTILMFVAVLALAGCGPSCEDQGKATVLVGVIPSTVMAGNVPIVTNIPIYGCLDVGVMKGGDARRMQ